MNGPIDEKQKQAAIGVREWRITISHLTRPRHMSLALFLMASAFEGADVEFTTFEKLDCFERKGISIKWSAERARWVVKYI